VGVSVAEGLNTAVKRAEALLSEVISISFYIIHDGQSRDGLFLINRQRKNVCGKRLLSAHMGWVINAG